MSGVCSDPTQCLWLLSRSGVGRFIDRSGQPPMGHFLRTCFRDRPGRVGPHPQCDQSAKRQAMACTPRLAVVYTHPPQDRLYRRLQQRRLIARSVRLTITSNKRRCWRSRTHLPRQLRKGMGGSGGLTIEIRRSSKTFRRRIGRIQCSRHGSGLGLVSPYSALALAIHRYLSARPGDDHPSQFSMHGRWPGGVRTTTKGGIRRLFAASSPSEDSCVGGSLAFIA